MSSGSPRLIGARGLYAVFFDVIIPNCDIRRSCQYINRISNLRVSINLKARKYNHAFVSGVRFFLYTRKMIIPCNSENESKKNGGGCAPEI